jgi:hypothetical protein
MFTNSKKKINFFLALVIDECRRRYIHRSFVAFDVLLYAERSYVDGRGDEREMATEL